MSEDPASASDGASAGPSSAVTQLLEAYLATIAPPVSMIFPDANVLNCRARTVITAAEALRERGFSFAGWRSVFLDTIIL